MDAARPRLRLGLAQLLARRALPGVARSSPSRTRRPARVPRAASAGERRGRHRGRERLRARASASTGFSRSRCSSTCATTRRCSAGSRRGSSPDGLFFVHVFTTARYAYAYDDGWMARTFFTGGNDALGRPAPPFPARPRAPATTGASAASTTRGPPRRGWSGSTATASRRSSCSPTRTAQRAPRRGSRTGASSSSPARSSGATAAAASGSSRTTSSLLVTRNGKRPSRRPLSRRRTSVSLADGRRRACPSSCNAKTPATAGVPVMNLTGQIQLSAPTDWSVLDPTTGCFVERGELEGEQLPQPLLARDGRAAETVDQRASDGGVDGRDEFEP